MSGGMAGAVTTHVQNTILPADDFKGTNCPNTHSMMGLQVWWTSDPDNAFDTRYEKVGTLWPGASDDYAKGAGPSLNRGDNNFIQCAEFDPSRNERITFAEIRSRDDAVDWIMIDTNNQNNKPNNGHAFAHGTSGIGTSHVWKDKSDANTPPNFQLGWGFLCGFSGSADIWIDSLRFNFLRGVENGALQDVKWTTQYSTIPDGSSTLGYKSTDINICQKASDAGIKQTIKYSQSYSVSTTTKYSNTFGMKLSNKISMTAKQGLKVGEASSELTQSVELSTEFSSSTTNENQEVKSETQTTDSTLELPLPCPTDDYAKKSQLSFPMYCQWSFGYDLAFTWNNDAWVGSMVYTLEGGGKITFPAKGSTSGKYYTANFGMRNFNCSNHDEPTTNRAGIKQQMDMPPSPLSKYPVTAAASLAGSSAVPPVNSKATGYVSITIVNASYASGLFYATNVKQMTMAHLHNGAVGNNGPPIAWAFNATYGPLSGSLKAFFRFDPSLSNFSALLAAGQVYFNIHTVAYPAGELRGQL